MAITDPLDDGTYEAIRELTELRIRTYMVIRSDLDALLRRIHLEAHVRAARTELLIRSPEDSANRVLSNGQRLFFGLLLLALAAGLRAGAAEHRDRARNRVRRALPLLLALQAEALLRLVRPPAGVRLLRRGGRRDRRSRAAALLHPRAALPRGGGRAAADRGPGGARLPELEAGDPAALRGGGRGDDRRDPRLRPAAAVQPPARPRQPARRRSRRPATTGSSRPPASSSSSTTPRTSRTPISSRRCCWPGSAPRTT